jgi:hypothetical protein
VTADSTDIDALLDSIATHLEECRAAAAVAADGDTDGLVALGAEVDEMAAELARLKAAVSSPSFGA